ncbi:hypothetical protein ABW19_dt0206913 [Dactylella cylindrospora]|nr:hypothetical protein ABW19_dt0206913 [Dactylella cylindrospora]
MRSSKSTWLHFYRSTRLRPYCAMELRRTFWIFFVFVGVLGLLHVTAFGLITPAVKRQISESSTTDLPITAVSECHLHGETQYCLHGATEYRVIATITATNNLPESYTGCHNHGTELYCFAPTGGAEVQIDLGEQDAPTSVTDSLATVTASPATVTAVSDCHLHGTSVYCMVGNTEYLVFATATSTSDLPAAYTNCHSHDSEMYCVSPDGEDVEVQLASADSTTDEESESPAGQNCHFHAGVEHCVGANSESGSPSCDRVDRDYNIKLRVGMLFAILVTSAIGVFGPIFLIMVIPPKAHSVFLVFKQFGTGVIISTAFVHLLTHASLMFGNECLGELKYEATPAAILMAGIFLSFIVEYLGFRFVQWRNNKEKSRSEPLGATKPGLSNEILSVSVMEAGILFHSLLIGLTLVVAGDNYLVTLFVVIMFHQMFEGVALGTRIASLGRPGATTKLNHLHSHSHSLKEAPSPTAATTANSTTTAEPSDDLESRGISVSLVNQCLMASAFAFITPLGMAIGIGVLNVFNGNDPSTIIAIGTLDAFSAGILVWVGVVEMWAGDWMGGELSNSGIFTTLVSGIGLVLGMILMSFLGKWA